jgi:hypothetical protein
MLQKGTRFGPNSRPYSRAVDVGCLAVLMDTLRRSAPDEINTLCFNGELSSDYQWRTRPTSTCTKSELR